MKTTFLAVALLGLVCCKKETPPPNYGTPHKMTLGVKKNIASTSQDGITSANIVYSGAHGEFTYSRAYPDTVPYPKTWDTSFTAYPNGQIKYTVAVNSYNLKIYMTDDYKKGDTTFLVAEPDKVNTIMFTVKD
jgi:hypothetical protein